MTPTQSIILLVLLGAIIVVSVFSCVDAIRTDRKVRAAFERATAAHQRAQEAHQRAMAAYRAARFEPTSGLWHSQLSPAELLPSVTVTPMPARLELGRFKRTLRPTKWHREEIRGRHYLVVDEAVDEESGNLITPKGAAT